MKRRVVMYNAYASRHEDNDIVSRKDNDTGLCCEECHANTFVYTNGEATCKNCGLVVAGYQELVYSVSDYNRIDTTLESSCQNDSDIGCKRPSRLKGVRKSSIVTSSLTTKSSAMNSAMNVAIGAIGKALNMESDNTKNIALDLAQTFAADSSNSEHMGLITRNMHAFASACMFWALRGTSGCGVTCDEMVSNLFNSNMFTSEDMASKFAKMMNKMCQVVQCHYQTMVQYQHYFRDLNEWDIFPRMLTKMYGSQSSTEKDEIRKNVSDVLRKLNKDVCRDIGAVGIVNGVLSYIFHNKSYLLFCDKTKDMKILVKVAGIPQKSLDVLRGKIETILNLP